MVKWICPHVKRCASDSEMSKQDSFCSSKNEQGARSLDRPPLKIGLLRERWTTVNRIVSLAASRQTGLIGALRARSLFASS